MAGGPIFPSSAYPLTAGNCFPNIYVGSGAGPSKQDEGLGVAASITTDSTWVVRFPLPPQIPTGTAKILLRGLANTTSGIAKVTIQDAVVAPGSSPSAASLTSESQVSQTWVTADIYVDNKIVITPTPTANGVLIANIVYNSSGWTLAVVSTWMPILIWE